jgi:hypothetical protein
MDENVFHSSAIILFATCRLPILIRPSRFKTFLIRGNPIQSASIRGRKKARLPPRTPNTSPFNDLHPETAKDDLHPSSFRLPPLSFFTWDRTPAT